MKTFQLDIVTPRQLFYSGPAEQLSFQSVDGSYGVLPGHEPTLTALSEGEVSFVVDGEWRYAVTSDGFVEIMPGYVRMLTMAAVRPEDIDAQRAQRAKERAQEQLKHQQNQQDYFRSQAALARALTRLKYARRKSS
ncbi:MULTISPECIES: ATP synthase F1 subunit epsilon [Jonquetella]|uniref:ATP synthase epsilon chain n=1 Tax=Jonquetella anthropi DSM 22815 TaxID=885272 RepID=H0UJZ1_9BACT|nr:MULTISPECIES: ATP synthase F1 subunit epsilon [Jonquetella]EEX48557.1 ATP synthase F1, epsilon subunit [Jonquetella anthropi E3_33 E1]EHM13001.1 ATP synthase, F1 epsilon subunit [Jonquetella anthropi DSM 22815]ERL23802.1 ATP synthase F1, epsilon subunit [Jonquetella sp. BV3C21]